MKNWRLLKGVNTDHDITAVDPLSFQIMGSKKALFYKVVKLIRPVPNEVLDQLTSPLAVALRNVYYRYLEVETQEWRRDLYTRIIPFFILMVAEEGDANHSETFHWFVYELWKELDAGEVEFPLNALLPYNWWDEQKGGRNWIDVSYRGKRTTNAIIRTEA